MKTFNEFLDSLEDDYQKKLSEDATSAFLGNDS